MTTSNRDARLREWLRAGDPLPPAEKLSTTAASRIRREMLTAPRPVTPHRGWQAAAVAAALATVIAGSQLMTGTPRRLLERFTSDDPTTEPIDPPRRVAAIDSNDEPADRQIQFTTRGGTRVIWLLKPKMSLDTQP